MIGVILWSDPIDRKAVIWCEDQGDLAYLLGSGTPTLHDSFVEVGDIVEFEVATERNLRYARNPNLVAPREGSGLVNELKAFDTGTPHPPSGSAEIIPFRLAPPVRHSAGAHRHSREA